MKIIRKMTLIMIMLASFSALVSSMKPASVLNRQLGSSYAIKDNKLFVNPGNDARYISGILSFDMQWFDAIKYFNHNGYDVEADALYMDYDIPMMMVSTSASTSGRLLKDTIWFNEYNRSPNRKNPLLLLSGFSIYTSELEVCGMRVGDTKTEVARFIGLSNKFIEDTIVVVDPGKVNRGSCWAFLLTGKNGVVLNKRISERWPDMTDSDIKIIFDNDTIKAFDLY